MLEFTEHLGYKQTEYLNGAEYLSSLTDDQYSKSFSKQHKGRTKHENCFLIKCLDREQQKFSIETGYYIGVDWVIEHTLPLIIEPKLNNKTEQVDYLQMLFSCIKHPEVTDKITQLFEVKWDKPKIQISQQQDLLTPFLILEFLGVLRKIIKKGLKKSYYKMEQNLYGKVKGKVLVSKTIKHNHFKNKNLSTYCSFDEFGVNNKENRFLKKTFEFCKSYLPQFDKISKPEDLVDLFNFINPAFDKVDGTIDIRELRSHKSNSFYKEYDEALRLAKLIFKRFGYNVSKVAEDLVETPPFLIDMSKLFELYVLSILRKRFPTDKELLYQPDIKGLFPDYLLRSKMKIIKLLLMLSTRITLEIQLVLMILRQVSGYARMNTVYEKFRAGGQPANNKCLFIYPKGEIGSQEKIQTQSICQLKVSPKKIS